jgi:ABC-type multidrug transport system fused ATPase/permease subunit
MVRSILIVEIYRKATVARIDTGRDSAALTLMSTDMDRINMGLRSIHDVWASLVQVALASWMLYLQLGKAFVAPIALVTVCAAALGVLMKLTGDSQRDWMTKVQERVGLTATVIASMKSLKISALSKIVGDFVQKLRVDELAAGTRYRTIVILAALLGFVPLFIGPPLTFAFSRGQMDATKIFTSLSYLLLLTNPLTQIFQSIPEILSALACLGRIQSFLEYADRRRSLTDSDTTQHEGEKSPTQHPTLVGHAPRSPPSISIENGAFGWQSGKPVLCDINISIPAGSLTVVVGSVGSGKSTLLQALLGETPFNEGRVSFSARVPHIGYCHQTPFLSNGSIRNNIIGFLPFDPVRYAEVITATALTVDLVLLPQGDDTNVGSDGITLSGGQKQRIALARALYVDTKLVVLDDVFSGLDANTEDQISRQIFGPDGLLHRRNATTVLCTNSHKQLVSADHVLALDHGKVIEQGSLKELLSRSSYVSSLLSDFETQDGTSSTGSTDVGDNFPATEVTLIGAKGAAATLSTPGSDNSRQMGDTVAYKHYFKSVGLSMAISSIIFGAGCGAFTNLSTVCEYKCSGRVRAHIDKSSSLTSNATGLKFWSDDAFRPHPTHSFAWYAGIYALLQVCALMSLLLLAVAVLILFVKKAGASLHWDLLKTLIHAPLSFFVATDTGVVTNLFSQDLNLVDTELPNAFLNTLYCVSPSYQSCNK